MRGLFTSILTILSFASLQAQNSIPKNPKAVIGITVDQLRTDYLEAFYSLYREDGLKKLWSEGKVYTNVEFTFKFLSKAANYASIHTGTSPKLHGIISDQWLNKATLQPTSAVEDDRYLGNYTTQAVAPTKLLTSTASDELKKATQGKALVFSIAPTAEAAIFGAGHAGDAAIWLNAETGKWCSTTFYKDFPWWVGRHNETNGVDQRISEMVWEPLLPSFKYDFLPAQRKASFKHRLESNREQKYRRLCTSPFINSEINRLAEELFQQSGVGEDNITDLVNLTYYVGPYKESNIEEYPMELQDAYIRLDHTIAELLKIIDKTIGLENTFIYLTSTGYQKPESHLFDQYNIPTGDFYLNRCAALLNMYLMATYGEGEYVESYHNQQIYLNSKLIEEKHLKLEEIQAKSALFLMQFSGVYAAYHENQLLLGAWNPEVEKVRNSFHRKISGDLLIDVLPGWTIINENGDNQVTNYSPIPAPIILYSPYLKGERINTPVYFEQIAPTVSRVLRIRAPNASTLPPLKGI